ncbi:MAG TPA: methyltransferase domain-containing protein [Longimicrobium sp.]|jgi:SAM-dependent methyltransferase
MLLTLRTTDRLHAGFARGPDHPPGDVRSVDLPAGQAYLFHPGIDTAAVLVELDPVALRAATGPFPGYAPYAGSALLGTALGHLLAPAVAADDDEPRTVEARVSVLACPDASVLNRLFEPLGYAVHAARLPFDPDDPRSGASWLYTVTLAGRQRLRDVVSHLRVLLPLFDDGWARRARDAEAAGLWEEGRPWLETHPERPVLERRLLRLGRPVTHERRHEAVLAALKESGARRVLDLGCGPGELLASLLEEPQFDEVVGVEVARDELARAAARLAPGGRGRVLHGSLAYRDARLAGFDAAAVVEVIEHLDPPQLAAFEDAVWEGARPGTVVVTTPNADYNTLFPDRGTRMRHPDHRFEWTRAEFRAWAEGVAVRHRYGVRFGAVGPEDEHVGPLTQMAVFHRLPGAPASVGASTADAAADGDAAGRPGAGIDLADVAGERTVSTRLGGGVHVSASEAAAALEVMGRFAVDPRWLVYLPPTTPAAVAPAGAEALEHPSAALAYYRRRGVTGVALEELHGGRRVTAVVCRDADVARLRFRAAQGETGAVYTAAGRPFFATRAAEEAFLARLRGALDGGGVWDELATGWVALEGVMGPGVPLMREVDSRLHPPPSLHWALSAAARGTLAAEEAALAEAVAHGVDAAALLARTRERAALAAAYTATCRRALRPVTAPHALRLAPVRILAGERAVHAEHDPRWHRERLARACQSAPHTLRETEQTLLDLTRPPAEAEAWWQAALARGSAGIVVRPLEGGSGDGEGAPAPALKCRGEDALRLVHGPEHTLPEHRERLRGRGLGEEAVRAAREWALSVEALDRFVRGESPTRVHECVFAALAVKNGPRP